MMQAAFHPTRLRARAKALISGNPKFGGDAKKRQPGGVPMQLLVRNLRRNTNYVFSSTLRTRCTRSVAAKGFVMSSTPASSRPW